MRGLSVCIETLWTDLPHEERIVRCAELGFEAIEFWHWRNKDLNAIRGTVRETGVAVAAFCLQPDFALTNPEVTQRLLDDAEASVDAARFLGAKRLIGTIGSAPEDRSPDETLEIIVRNLKALAPLLERHAVTLCVEPLNTVDHPGYFLTRMDMACDIVDAVGSERVRVLLDFYHQERTEGGALKLFRQHEARIAHIHCAGVPDRGELTNSSLDYADVFGALKVSNYSGYVGLEFMPHGYPELALSEARRLRQNV